jgi:hypothetical protein
MERAIEAHIERALAQAPPLTVEQRAQLAELLQPIRLARRQRALDAEREVARP